MMREASQFIAGLIDSTKIDEIGAACCSQPFKIANMELVAPRTVKTHWQCQCEQMGFYFYSKITRKCYEEFDNLKDWVKCFSREEE